MEDQSSALIFGSRCTFTSGSPALRCRSKISASESLASTNTPRTRYLPCFFPCVLLSGRDAGERQHGMHQHIGARGAIELGRVFQLIVADAVLAGHEHHCRRHDGGEIAGVVAGARGDAAMAVA